MRQPRRVLPAGYLLSELTQSRESLAILAAEPETKQMKPYVILVEFAVHSGQEQAFEELILENARRSRGDEPGCLVFDVLTRHGSEFNFVLYEIYVDRTAFDAHLRAPHFHVFDEASRPLVQRKQVTELSLLSPLPTRERAPD